MNVNQLQRSDASLGQTFEYHTNTGCPRITRTFETAGIAFGQFLRYLQKYDFCLKGHFMWFGTLKMR